MSTMNLVGIHMKIRRAEQHIQAIRDEMDKLCKNLHQGIVREVRKDVDEQVWIYRDDTPDAPVMWSIRIGEILYNLRSALDHLVWQLVSNNGQTPGRHNEFPIALDQQSWQKRKANALKGVSERHQEMIGYLQPFTGGINLPFNVAMLKAIHDLSNIEKHRHLVVAVLASNGIEPMTRETNLSDLSEIKTRSPFEGTVFHAKIERGKVLAKFNNADIPLDPSFLIDVRFAGEAQRWTMGYSVPFMLAKCLDTVKGVVAFLTTSMGDSFVETGRNQ